MKSYQMLLSELYKSADQKNVDGIIKTIESALTSCVQIENLKKAFIFFNPVEIDKKRCTILHYAFQVKSTKLKKLLLDNELVPKTSFTRRNATGWSILSEAIIYKNYEDLEFALQHHFDPNELFEYTRSLDVTDYSIPLYHKKIKSLLTIAAEKHDLRSLNLLIDHKADVCRFGPESIVGAIATVGHHRRYQKNYSSEILYEVVKLLIDSGANMMWFNKRPNKMIAEIMFDVLNTKYAVDKKVLRLINKEISDRKMLNYTIPLFLFATKEVGLPREINEKIANFTRNRIS